MLKEITERTSGGTTVTLFVEFEQTYSGTEQPLYGLVRVDSETESFDLPELPLHQCADVYYHPYAYASRLLKTGRLERVAA
jgi:hypothetical protein